MLKLEKSIFSAAVHKVKLRASTLSFNFLRRARACVNVNGKFTYDASSERVTVILREKRKVPFI